MRAFSIAVFFLTIASTVAVAQGSKAAPPLTPAACKSDLKAWSAQKTESLTIDQIMERMNVMFACADQEKKHEKKMRAYLDEFYRTHSELAGRAFDFIVDHNLRDEFYKEKNGSEETANVPESKRDPKN